MISNPSSCEQQIITAIHQPNYLPWLGVFHKIDYADKFVFHDMIQFSKAEFTKRVMINTNRGSHWITVPLKRHPTDTKIRDVQVAEDSDWVKKHLNMLKGNYAQAAYFKQYYPCISDWLNYCRKFRYLAEINIYLIKEILKILNIEKELYKSSELAVTGKNVDLNINIIKRLGGNVYFSGVGARDYQKQEDFTNNSIKLIYQDIYNFLSRHPYPQLHSRSNSSFTNGLSIVDALFNIGPEAIRTIFRSQ